MRACLSALPHGVQLAVGLLAALLLTWLAGQWRVGLLIAWLRAAYRYMCRRVRM